MSCAKAAGTARHPFSPRQVERDASESTGEILCLSTHGHGCLCSAPPTAPDTVCSEHRSTQPSRSSAQRLSAGGRKSHSCWIQPQSHSILEPLGFLNSTWGAAAAPAVGTGHTRTGKVSQGRNTCISAAERLLQRQWHEHQVESLTELGQLSGESWSPALGGVPGAWLSLGKAAALLWRNSGTDRPESNRGNQELESRKSLLEKSPTQIKTDAANRNRKRVSNTWFLSLSLAKFSGSCRKDEVSRWRSSKEEGTVVSAAAPSGGHMKNQMSWEPTACCLLLCSYFIDKAKLSQSTLCLF